MARSISEGEAALAAALEAEKIPGWDLTTEYQFHPERLWRFDFAFPSQKLAIEVDGRGHFRGKMATDYEKQNEAVRLGWRVLRFPAGQKKKAAEWAALIIEVLIQAA